jgi:isoquinoline 1-oxidoreductase beta subunit
MIRSHAMMTDNGVKIERTTVAAPTTLSRRSVLKAGAGLALGVYLAPSGKSFAQTTPAAANVNIAPNTFLIIGNDNTVTVLSKHIEMGQGPLTGMATLVASSGFLANVSALICRK